ncbi:EthD family reductase [Variovorax paradoxus]|nr:EthD family reductase [Variovorax paradoxus]MBT2305536.1 EthD family reductase [Variovorax paradoxus]
MFKVLVLYHPPASADHFRRYYVDKHLPLAAQLPGLKASRHSFDLQGPDGVSPYFCVWEGEFESADAMAAAMQSPAGKQVLDDVVNYATGGAVVLNYSPVEG